jgi:ABC-2 type transport system permease protein
MTDPIGFFGTEAYLFMTLFGSVYAMILFSGFLAREESEKTIEFLLSKPHNRAGILTSKLLAGVFCITVFNTVYGIANFILMESYVKGDYSRKELLLLLIAPLIMHLVFGFLATMISVFVPRTRSVYPISIGIVLGSYFLSIASTLTENGEFLKYLSFFKYIDAADIVENTGFSVLYSILFASVTVVFITVTYLFYMRKDIHA